MDQFDRGSRMRQNERSVRERLTGAERERERARLLGDVEDDPGSRYLLLGIVIVLILAVLAVAVYVELAQPPVERPAAADEPAWGTATDEDTRVQPPAWWLTEP